MHTPLPPDPRRRIAPAVERNREPILAVLQRFLPQTGTLLELASGTGEHAVFFASHLPGLSVQPSDVEPNNLTSINAWREASALPNLLPPLCIDLSRDDTTASATYDAAFCANLIHIAPSRVCENLMRFVGAGLKSGAPFIMYGPYKVNGQHTAESNVAFEHWLWSQSPEYGVRDLADVVALARSQGLVLLERVAMPANNFCLVFEKQPAL